MTAAQLPHSHTELLGRGRSGIVFRDTDEHGRRIARKVFLGEWLSRGVLYALTGAPNPYGWCEPAVRAAVCRREMLRLLTCGLRIAKIAQSLGIRQSTVRNHIEHILAKLGVHSRLEAVVFAAQHRLV